MGRIDIITNKRSICIDINKKSMTKIFVLLSDRQLIKYYNYTKREKNEKEKEDLRWFLINSPSRMKRAF